MFALRLFFALAAFVLALPGFALAMPGAVPASVLAATEKAGGSGRVRVIVRLDVPAQVESTLSTDELRSAQRGAIAASQDLLRAEIDTTPNVIVHREFETIPYSVVEVDAAGLKELEASGIAVEVFEDRLGTTQLMQSAPMIGAPEAWKAGLDGSTWNVAVLDSGVDSNHPFLAGRVVAEACFSAAGSCPNGQTTMVGRGAGAQCNYSAECAHGTHVAGIVAGRTTDGAGVAPGAGIIAIQVFSRYDDAQQCAPGTPPCARTALSDQMAALEWVFRLRGQLPIAAVNMSLGFGQKFTEQATCDAAAPGYKAIVANLLAAGIATVAASGNEGFSDGLGYPACLSNIVSVGAVSKTDQVAQFSNSASFLTLLAPGVEILSSTSVTPVSNASYGRQSGTSQAAPHVAGAWAILKQQRPNASVLDIATLLHRTGKVVTDTNGVSTPRIQLAGALATGATPVGPQSGLQYTPDGRRVLVNKSIGAQQWAITLNEDGSVTGNIFDTNGQPEFLACDQTGNDGNPDLAQRTLLYRCKIASGCASATCPAPGDWRDIAGQVSLPAAFFLPRSATAGSNSLASGSNATADASHLPQLARPAGGGTVPSALQTTPRADRILVNKRVGNEQWAITKDLRDQTVTGNVFFLDGSEPAFLACNPVSHDANPDPRKAITRYQCAASKKCDSNQCPGPGDWQLFQNEVPIPGEFFLPRF